MNKPDVLRITQDQNPAFIQALADAQTRIGDQGKAELRYTLKGQDEEGVDLIVEAVIPEGYEEATESEAATLPATPTSETPVMTPTAMLIQKKKA